MYLTFTEYQSMGGTLDETTFNQLEYEAEVKINWYTFNRLKNEVEFPMEVKRCVMKLISLIQMTDPASYSVEGSDSGKSAGISSESNDGVSRSYNVISASESIERASEQIEQCIQTYLTGVYNSLGQLLLYRGLYKGE